MGELMINRYLFRSLREFKEYTNAAPINFKGTGLPRTPKPVIHPHGPGYRMYPELSRPAAGYLMAQASPALAYFGLPAYVAVSATEVFPEVSGPMYQSAMSGQPSIGVSLGTLLETSGSSEGFKWYELGYWRGY